MATRAGSSLLDIHRHEALDGRAIRRDAEHVYVRLDDTGSRLDSQGVSVNLATCTGPATPAAPSPRDPWG